MFVLFMPMDAPFHDETSMFSTGRFLFSNFSMQVLIVGHHF